jgi:hypothetical protein
MSTEPEDLAFRFKGKFDDELLQDGVFQRASVNDLEAAAEILDEQAKEPYREDDGWQLRRALEEREARRKDFQRFLSMLTKGMTELSTRDLKRLDAGLKIMVRMADWADIGVRLRGPLSRAHYDVRHERERGRIVRRQEQRQREKRRAGGGE